jgi:prenyl protein peptidase
VTFSTTLCSLLTIVVLYQHDASAMQIPTLLGMWPVSLVDTVRTMLLVTILFAGPLFEHGIVDGAWRDWIRLKGLHETLSSWIGYRNFIVVRYPLCHSYLHLTHPGPR